MLKLALTFPNERTGSGQKCSSWTDPGACSSMNRAGTIQKNHLFVNQIQSEVPTESAPMIEVGPLDTS